MSESITPVAVTVGTGDDAANDDQIRYSFVLQDGSGKSLHFIVDVPMFTDSSIQTVDVWLNDHSVMVGDTPADGFATFTPA